jgi:hypothetical protein
VLLRAGPRRRSRDGDRPPLRHVPALGAALGRSRRRAAGDPRGDQHARGFAGGGRPRPVHRNGLAGPPPRSSGPRDGRDDPRGDAREGQPVLPAALRAGRVGRGGRGQPPPRGSARQAPRTDGHRSHRGNRRPAGLEPPREPDAPGVLREAARETAQDRAGAHLSRHERARAHRPRSLPVPGRERGARHGDVLAPVPGDPREARPRLLGLQLSLAVHGGGAVRVLRGDDAGSRGRGDRIAAPRAR